MGLGGIWAITELGVARVRKYQATGYDPDGPPPIDFDDPDTWG